MARIGIMTFLHNENYGSSLQAYALQRKIRDMGHECEHIDYRPDKTEKILNLVRSGNHPGLVIEGLRKRSVKASRQGARNKSRAIPAFYQRTMKLSPVCRNQSDLKKIAARYDILVCGSDQIWNPVWLNPAYFLTFAPDSIPKIAYAASLGVQQLPAAGKIRRIRTWTEGFRAISVREDEGAGLMEAITGSRPAVMPDPVCLLAKEEWAETAKPCTREKHYLLCYFIGDSDSYWEQVRRLQDETGLKVLVIPVTERSYQSGYELLEGIGPEEFTGAVQHADMLCTDSFHGLAFSGIFGVPAKLIYRYREDDPESKNSRVNHFQRMIRQKGIEQIRREGTDWLQSQL